MAQTFLYPTPAELRQIEQIKLPRLTAARPIFDIFPLETAEADLLIWDQMDNYTGLQQLRGLNGEPPKVNWVGAKRYVEQPGVYGEWQTIDEQMLLQAGRLGALGGPALDAAALVMLAQDNLLGRRLDRIEQIGWALLTTGTFSVATIQGAVAHTGTYTTQSVASAAPWATLNTATPFVDFRTWALLGAGKSTNFGAAAKAYMNRITANTLLSNANANDLGGKRLASGANFLSFVDINRVLLDQDLPQIVIYDEGYVNDAATFVRYLPTGTVVIVGQRASGVPVGAYRMTRNVNNPNMAAGAYTKVVDKGDEEVPRTLQVHDGHNGGPVLYFPSAIIRANVA